MLDFLLLHCLQSFPIQPSVYEPATPQFCQIPKLFAAGKLFDCYTAGRLPFQHSQDPSTACLTQGLGDLGLWPAFAFCFCLFTANSSLFDHPLIQASCLAGGPIRDWGQVPPTNGREGLWGGGRWGWQQGEAGEPLGVWVAPCLHPLTSNLLPNHLKW